MFDPEKFGLEMAAVIRAALAPLEKQIAELQAKLAEKPDFTSAIESAVKAAVAAIPSPAPGKDCDMAQVAAMVADAVKALPAPKDGTPGASVTVADLAPVIAAEVAKAVSAIPAPKDGLGLAGAMIDRDGALQITLTNGDVKNLGLVVGRDGIDGTKGIDGKDGVSLENFELEYLPESHEVEIKAVCAGRAKSVRFPAGGIKHGGYWRAAQRAKAGETWTHGGQTYIAKRATEAEPASNSPDWEVFARRGKDGDNVVRTVKPAAPIKLGT